MSLTAKFRQKSTANFSGTGNLAVVEAKTTNSPLSVMEQPATGLTLKEFLGRVLPDHGRRVLYQDKRNYFFASNDELADAVEFKHDQLGVYFGTAGFGTEDRRTQSNVVARRCYHADIDCGEKKFAADPNGAYPTFEDGVRALVQACKDGLPAPSLIVRSGHGVHVYWVLDEDISAQDWKPVAKALGVAAKALKLKLDSHCTTDEARVLRPLESLHSVTEAGELRVSLVRDTKLVYKNADLFDALKKHVAEDDMFDLVAPAPTGERNINDDITSFKGPPASLERVAEHCAATALMRDKQGNVPEPLWRAVIGIAKYCDVDGERVVHEWSAGYDGYSRRETQEKMDRWDTPPTTCAHFASMCDACGTCKYRGKITTPKQLGYERETLSLSAQVSSDPEKQIGVTRETARAEIPHWKVNADGAKVRPLDTTDNLAALARLAGVTIHYNVMARKTEIVIPGMASGRDDGDNAAITFLGDLAARVGMSRGVVKELADAVAGSNPFHPVGEWIAADPWDGVSRREEFHRSFRLKDGSGAALRAKLVDAWMVSAIAAIHATDGISAQGVLVLCGPQACGKTRKVENLCPVPDSVRTGAHLNAQDKDSVFQATNAWIVELGELDHTVRRSDVSALKAFITRPVDVIRRPYAQTDNTYRRRTVFAGTVNGTGFLADETGDRRFWVLDVTECIMLPPEFMRQVWAEYAHMYRNGATWYLDAETEAALRESNAGHRVVDPIEEQIRTAYNWEATKQPGWERADTVQWETSTSICRQLGRDNPSRAEATRTGAVLRALNGGKSRRSNGVTLHAVPLFSDRSIKRW